MLLKRGQGTISPTGMGRKTHQFDSCVYGRGYAIHTARFGNASYFEGAFSSVVAAAFSPGFEGAFASALAWA